MKNPPGKPDGFDFKTPKCRLGKSFRTRYVSRWVVCLVYLPSPGRKGNPLGGLTSDINGLYDIPYKMFAVKK